MSRPGATTGLPSRRIRPSVSGSSPSRQYRNVVLPQPLGPTMARNSPDWTPTEHRSSASVVTPVRGFSYRTVTLMASSFGPTVRPPRARGYLHIHSASLRLLQEAPGAVPPAPAGCRPRRDSRVEMAVAVDV